MELHLIRRNVVTSPTCTTNSAVGLENLGQRCIDHIPEMHADSKESPTVNNIKQRLCGPLIVDKT